VPLVLGSTYTFLSPHAVSLNSSPLPIPICLQANPDYQLNPEDKQTRLSSYATPEQWASDCKRMGEPGCSLCCDRWPKSRVIGMRRN
jgi:hypothetical protein